MDARRLLESLAETAFLMHSECTNRTWRMLGSFTKTASLLLYYMGIGCRKGLGIMALVSSTKTGSLETDGILKLATS